MVRKVNNKTIDINGKSTAGTITISESAVIHDEILERRITLATECFTRKLPESVLRDRNRLSKENAMAVSEYIIAMKREINPRYNYVRYTIQFLSELSRAVGINKKFIDMTRDDLLSYLDKSRKPEMKIHCINGLVVTILDVLYYSGFSNGCTILISPIRRKEVNYLHKKAGLNV